MIYIDNHASTRCDPRVIEAMLPWFAEHGNPHSGSHESGRRGGSAIEQAIETIAPLVGATSESVVMTSGATESNNLAIRGVCNHPRQKRRRIVTATTEHPAVLDVCTDLEAEGFEVTRIGVHPNGHPMAGTPDLDQLADAVDEETALVSIMWANNEIGVVAPMKEIAEICHRQGALLHSDATQAVGRIQVDVKAADVDLISATAHKFYGPKGTGFLVVGNGNRRVRLKPQIVGGGQQRGLRSGTMNTAGVVGIATALEICADEMESHTAHAHQLRDRLLANLSKSIDGLALNGTPLESEWRLPGNLNLVLPEVEGAAWIAATPEVAFSSGSACSSAESKPSHVLTAIGLSESEARRSVRFGIGRFNTTEEIDVASKSLVDSYSELLAASNR